jgi:hypothetical protein
MKFPVIKPRRKDSPSIAQIISESNGGKKYSKKDNPFFESDRDFMENNREACVWFLEHAEQISFLIKKQG